MNGNGIYKGMILSNEYGVFIKGEKCARGKAFKNSEAYLEGDSICYVSDENLKKLDVMFNERGSFIPEAEILEEGLAETRHTIMKKVVDFLKDVKIYGSPIYMLADYMTVVNYLTWSTFLESEGEDVAVRVNVSDLEEIYETVKLYKIQNPNPEVLL